MRAPLSADEYLIIAHKVYMTLAETDRLWLDAPGPMLPLPTFVQAAVQPPKAAICVGF